MGSTRTLIGSVCVVIVAISFGFVYIQEVPPGIKSPWTIKAAYAIVKGLNYFEKDVLRRFRDQGELLLAWKTRYIPIPAKEIEALPVDVKTLYFDDVKVLLFTPRSLQKESNPGIVQFHGGGWTLLTTDFYENYCRHLSHETQTIVASVEYRLAPDHVYPAALDDCVTATVHFINNAKEYRVDASRVAVLGDSAGGNLAAAVSLKLRDTNFNPMPKLQIMIYPALQAIDFSTPSYQHHQDHAILSKASMAAYWLFYAVGHTKYLSSLMNNSHVSQQQKQFLNSDRMSHEKILNTHPYSRYQKPVVINENKAMWQELEPIFMDPYFAPLMSNNLSNLPDAFVLTVGQDVLRDDGLWFADSLKLFGVKVTLEYYEPCFHGLVAAPHHSDENVLESRELYHKYIRENL